MHYGELGSGQVFSNVFITGVGIKNVPVVYMGFALVSVIVSEYVMSAGKMGVVGISQHADPSGGRPVHVADLGDI